MQEDFFNSLVKKCCSLTPRDLIENMELEIERMRSGFGHSVWHPEWILHRQFLGIGSRWFDVFHDKENIQIYLDVRDINKENIDINITNKFIEIEVDEETNYQKKSFYQKISIIEDIDLENADAVIENGILKVTIPKKIEKIVKLKVR